MAKRLSGPVRDHLEWLGFIQPTGLVVSAHALDQRGAILNRRDIEGQQLLRECVGERRFRPGGEHEPFLPDFGRFVRRVLGWRFSPKGYAGMDGCPIPPELELPLPEYGETLVPDFAVRELDPRDGCPPWQLLVQVTDPGTDLDHSTDGAVEFAVPEHLQLLPLGVVVRAGESDSGGLAGVGGRDDFLDQPVPSAGADHLADARVAFGEVRVEGGSGGCQVWVIYLGHHVEERAETWRGRSTDCKLRKTGWPVPARLRRRSRFFGQLKSLT